MRTFYAFCWTAIVMLGAECWRETKNTGICSIESFQKIRWVLTIVSQASKDKILWTIFADLRSDMGLMSVSGSDWVVAADLGIEKSFRGNGLGEWCTRGLNQGDSLGDWWIWDGDDDYDDYELLSSGSQICPLRWLSRYSENSLACSGGGVRRAKEDSDMRQRRDIICITSR